MPEHSAQPRSTGPAVPAGLVATLSIAWTGEPLRSATTLGLAADERAERHFEQAYRVGLGFVFNPSFSLHPDSSRNSHFRDGRYLGHAFHTPSAAVGRCRYDVYAFTFDDDEGIGVRLVQIHMKPVDAGDACSDAFIGAFAAYTDHFQAMAPGRALPEDDPALRICVAVEERRRTGIRRRDRASRQYAYAQSQLLVVSLFGMPLEAFEQRDDHARDVYRLLYSHAAGVKEDVRAITGKDKGWSSAAFFEAWMQPGAVVVMSTPYPEAYAGERAHFLASELDVPPGRRDIADAGPAGAGPEPAQHYDDLPEYPPLRYVVPLAALYGLLYEEVLRDTYERLLCLQADADCNEFVNLLMVSTRNRELGRLTRRLARVGTLEHLRLPVSREVGNRIQGSKLQEQVSEAITTLRTLVVNTVVISLSVASITVALFAVLISAPWR